MPCRPTACLGSGSLQAAQARRWHRSLGASQTLWVIRALQGLARVRSPNTVDPAPAVPARLCTERDRRAAPQTLARVWALAWVRVRLQRTGQAQTP